MEVCVEYSRLISQLFILNQFKYFLICYFWLTLDWHFKYFRGKTAGNPNGKLTDVYGTLPLE